MIWSTFAIELAAADRIGVADAREQGKESAFEVGLLVAGLADAEPQLASIIGR